MRVGGKVIEWLVQTSGLVRPKQVQQLEIVFGVLIKFLSLQLGLE